MTRNLDLWQIECCVRKQFIFLKPTDKMPDNLRKAALSSKWFTDPEACLGSMTLGLLTFIGIGVLLGFSLDEIKNHVDVEPEIVDTKWLNFQRLSREKAVRKLHRHDLDKKDMAQLLDVKFSMCMRSIRATYFNRERVKISDFNY